MSPPVDTAATDLAPITRIQALHPQSAYGSEHKRRPARLSELRMRPPQGAGS
jgi:hypothetical protein